MLKFCDAKIMSVTESYFFNKFEICIFKSHVEALLYAQAILGAVSVAI
jgi:hypothetical protein